MIMKPRSRLGPKLLESYPKKAFQSGILFGGDEMLMVGFNFGFCKSRLGEFFCGGG